MEIGKLMEMVDNSLAGDYPNTEQKTARLYAIDENGNAEVAGEHGDVYELLDNPLSSLVAKMSHAVAVETCGWAAPVSNIDDDDEVVIPSQHPQRRRVRLFAVHNGKGFASALRFGDDWLNPVYDYGDAQGNLADAIASLYE